MATKTKSKPKATKPKTAKVNKTAKPKRPFVWYKTLWNSVMGVANSPGESATVKVGKHKVKLQRSENLNKYGNPVHTATVYNKDGSIASSYRGTGGQHLVTTNALHKAGIEVKRHKPDYFIRRKKKNGKTN